MKKHYFTITCCIVALSSITGFISGKSFVERKQSAVMALMKENSVLLHRNVSLLQQEVAILKVADDQPVLLSVKQATKEQSN